jgi:hypothetical protein
MHGTHQSSLSQSSSISLQIPPTQPTQPIPELHGSLGDMSHPLEDAHLVHPLSDPTVGEFSLGCYLSEEDHARLAFQHASNLCSSF